MAFENLAGLVSKARLQQAKNQQGELNDAMATGSNIGATIGNLIQQRKQQNLFAQLSQAIKTQGMPQQGPALPGVGMGLGGSQAPVSGIGAPAQDNKQQINSLLLKLDPEGVIANLIRQQTPLNPLQQSQLQKNLAEAQKAGRPQMEWSDTGRTNPKTGLPVLVDKATGQEKLGNIAGQKGKSEMDDFKEQARQDRLEKEYQDRVQRVIGARTGGLGLQDQKVDQAIHLRSMVNQSWNPQTKTYELPEMQQGELVMGLANLVSGSSVSNIEQLRSITPKTARGDMAHLVSYWTGKPVTNQPQEMIKNLVSSIDRQGKVSEQLRDKYVSGLKMLVPKGLEKERADSIANSQLTSSFSDILKESPDQGMGTVGIKPGTVEGGYMFMGGDPGDQKNWKKS